MPVDQDGNRADIVMDANSTINRMNLGRVYEMYFSASSRDVGKKIMQRLGIYPDDPDILEKVEAVYRNQRELFDEVYGYLLGYYAIISPLQFLKYQQIGDSDRISHIAHCIEDKVYVFFPTDNEPELKDIVLQLETYVRPTYGPITYVGNSGRRVTTKEYVRIAPIYMLLLDKIADDNSAVGSCKLQHHGFLTQSDKYSVPYRHKAVRSTGESEARIFAANCAPEAVAEMFDRSNNPETHRMIVERLLRDDHPERIDRLIDRHQQPYGGSVAIQLMRHVAVCSGWEPIYEPEEIQIHD